MLTVEEKVVVREIARDESWVVAKAVEEANRIARALEESVGAIATTQADHTAAIDELKGDVAELKGDVAELKGDVAELKGAMKALLDHFEIEIPSEE